ncbi:MAG: patatin-like phospholipase family protein [Flavobacteriales bacterium]|jgi:NTE family protein|nr:patatin-like phospholipase family protein [Flavobacteriales bacterium]
MEHRPFVLSGGGVRGAAHAGVLQALALRGIVPDAISGTSAGALVGALVADGHAPGDLMPMLHDALRHARLWRRPRAGSRRLEDFLRAHLRAERFEDLRMPLHVTATDLERGGQRIFSAGPLVPALMASCAVPLVFPPVLIDGTHYVDGGLSNNLPVEPFAARHAETIAVYVNPLSPFGPGRLGRFAMLDRVWHLSFRELVMRSAKGCHLFIEPPALSAFVMFDLRKLEAAERIGFAYATALPLPA